MTPSPTRESDFVLTAPSGAELRLMPERAAWCPHSETLFVADVHLGKAATFRARGLPVPQGTTTETLTRLSQALRRSGARELVVLGDLLHARESHASDTLAAVQRWRDAHPGLRCSVVMGNHDRHAGPLGASLGFDPLPGGHHSEHWLGVHEEADLSPTQAADTRLVLAGHLHPVAVLNGRTDRLRLPCFWLRERVLTLPAFGAFTGGHRIETQGARTFVVAERVMELGAP